MHSAGKKITASAFTVLKASLRGARGFQRRCAAVRTQNADHQVCSGGRWGGGQDLPPHLLHHQRLSRGVHPHRLRQLQRADERGRPHGQPQPVGHGRPGGVRPAAHALLPTDQRLHHLLLHRQPLVLRQRAAQVAPRGVAPLPQRAHPAGRHQAGPALGRGDAEEAEGAGPCAHLSPAGRCSGQADRSGEIPGVLCAAPGGCEGGVRGGCARCALSCYQKECQEVCALIVGRRSDELVNKLCRGLLV